MSKARRKLFLGIAAGIGAGVLWGLVFLAPQILRDFTPYEITFGRFLFFGLISLCFFNSIIRVIKVLSPRELLDVVLLSAAGFWVYTVVLVWSVQINGGVVTTLVIGTLPITIALSSHGRRALRGSFAVGLLLLMAGMLVLNGVPLLKTAGANPSLSLIGVIGLVAALAMWTWYAVKSTIFLQRRADFSRRDFIGLIGLLSCVFLLILAFIIPGAGHVLHHPQLTLYLGASAVLGIGSTWLAYWLWSVCSTWCPPTVSGPLIVVETVSGLVFTFLYQGRLPTWFEATAMILFLTGSFLCIRSEVKNAA